MSFLKKLFGGGAGKPDSMPSEMHEGYIITPAPMSDGGQFRLCANIRKEIGGVMKSYTLIRADVFASSDQAAQASISKAKQVIREQGDNLFK